MRVLARLRSADGVLSVFVQERKSAMMVYRIRNNWSHVFDGLLDEDHMYHRCRNTFFATRSNANAE